MRTCRVVRHAVTQPLDQSIKLIPLTQGQNAIVDATDYDWLNQWNWFAYWSTHTQSFYARRNGSVTELLKIISMHAVILACDSGELADHKNHDTLDNRRENLRRCGNEQNSKNRKMYRRNTSGFKGVFWAKDRQLWRAMIRNNRKLIRLGQFTSREDAARAYNEAAKVLHGEFAHLNPI